MRLSNPKLSEARIRMKEVSPLTSVTNEPAIVGASTAFEMIFPVSAENSHLCVQIPYGRRYSDVFAQDTAEQPDSFGSRTIQPTVQCLRVVRGVAAGGDTEQSPVAAAQPEVDFRCHIQHAIGRDHLRPCIHLPIAQACCFDSGQIINDYTAELHHVVVHTHAVVPSRGVEIRVRGTFLFELLLAIGVRDVLDSLETLRVGVDLLTAQRGDLCRYRGTKRADHADRSDGQANQFCTHTMNYRPIIRIRHWFQLVQRSTSEYKLAPINRKVRELLGAEPPRYRTVPRGRVAEQWIGFSVDEIDRVKDREDNRYTRKRYPLLELGMSRKDCERWLSACVQTDRIVVLAW
ncbi:hypothetical protein LBW94_019265 [Nocardia sp. alder85J]|nr:hypothetical protein [Nocardia sp. alder85J]